MSGTGGVRFTSSRAAAFASSCLILLAACSHGSSGPLPAAAGLLQRSAAAMRSVSSAQFELTGSGKIAGVTVNKAEGVITSDGKASGSVQITQAGVLVQLDLVVIHGDIYIKGPTGGFAKLPPGAAGTVFDPSQILNPERGLAGLLDTAKGAKTVDQESVGGVDAYKVTATLEGKLVSHLMPLPSATSVPATLWIGVSNPQLEQIALTAPEGNGQQAQLTLHLGDFGIPVTITPPT